MDVSNPIRIGSDQLEVQVSPHGGALVGVRFTGQARNLVLGFADPAQRHIHPFAGPLVGPIANRIAHGKVVIDGQSHQMERNEHARHTLHSGDAGLHNRLWEVQDYDTHHVTLTCALADGACGLPGNRHITARYSVVQNDLTLDLGATSDAATVMNIAPHAYWNLDGCADVSAHQLRLNAQHYLPVDAEMIPTGAQAPVSETQFDFTQMRPVPLEPWLDVNFCLSTPPHGPLREAAQLRGSDGSTLTLSTTTPGLQVYNGALLPNTPVAMDDCPPIAPYSAIALEPQGWPDAPNHAHFPSITLGPDAPYMQRSVFHLSQNTE